MKRLWIVFAIAQAIGHWAAWMLLVSPLAGPYAVPLLATTFILLFPGNILGFFIAQHTLPAFSPGAFTSLAITDAIAILINAAVWYLLFRTYRRIRRRIKAS
jgi:hypothetical protein